MASTMITAKDNDGDGSNNKEYKLDQTLETKSE